MKKPSFIKCLLLSTLFACLFGNSLSAQEDSISQEPEENVITATLNQENLNKPEFYENWFVGLKGGTTYFISPLKSNSFSWGTSFTVGKQLNSKLAFRLDYMIGNLKSEGEFTSENSDGSFFNDDLKADVDFSELAILMKLSINDLLYSQSPRFVREFYLFGGAAFTSYRTKITDLQGNYIQGAGYKDNGDQDKMVNMMTIPLGVGVTYKLDKRDIFGLNLEFGYRFGQSADLDGGLTPEASNYTFLSMGLMANLGQPTLTPQKITADMIKEDLEGVVISELDKEVKKMENTTKPMKEEMARQSAQLAENQQQLEILQDEMDARTEAISVQMTESKGSEVGGIDLNSVYFAFNSTYITPAMEREIALIAKVLKKNKDLTCEIVGNASNVGSPEYNMQLSQKRAEGVYNLLIDEFKIDATRLSISNRGQDDPLAETLNRINRRVDLILK
jgi:outer membrane protein OmpA-like peptidoglycan-associated protein